MRDAGIFAHLPRRRAEGAEIISLIASRWARHLRASACIGAVAVAAGGGVALAAQSAVKVDPPANVRAERTYEITFHGNARHRERWYLFVDYHRCGANPAVEHARTTGVWGFVRGRFEHTSRGWKSSLSGTDHACVYLTKSSAPFNGATGVLAHSFVAYHVR